MRRHTALEILAWLVGALLMFACVHWSRGAEIDYKIAAVRSKRVAGETNPMIQQVMDPIDHQPGQDLVTIDPDGTEQVLVSAGSGAIFDICPSLDASKIYFSWVHDQTKVNSQVRARAAISGADLFVVDVVTREVSRLTHQEFTPNTGVADWSEAKWNQPIFAHQGATGVSMGCGVYNCGACAIPDGRGGEQLVFTSSRNGFIPPKGYSFPNLQMFRMRADGKNVEHTGHLHIGSALHPILMKSGAIAISQWEMQALRDQRAWGLWEFHPDGTSWGPLFSALVGDVALHWQTQLTDGRLVQCGYYLNNNWGFGSLFSLYRDPPGTIPSARFASWFATHPTNPKQLAPAYGASTTTNWGPLNKQFAFSPSRLSVLTEFVNWLDTASALDKVTGIPMGKVTQPIGAPNNHILCVYSPGRVNKLNRPAAEAAWCQIAIFDATQPITHPSQLTILKADPNYHYQQPHPLVPWTRIYGELPRHVPDVANDGHLHAMLPAGTPYFLLGTSSLYKRDSAPGYRQGTQIVGNLTQQGADVGVYGNDEIWGVRIVQLEPRSHAKYVAKVTRPQPAALARKNHFGGEIASVLAEIPARKGDGILDPDGNPDTSFLARLPSDVPFGMQLINYKGQVLAREGTWKQGRPGAIENKCGGCHAHSQVGTDFSLCAAAREDYEIRTYTQAKTPEFVRDIKPIIDAHCAACHQPGHPTGLVLSGTAEEQYQALASYTQAGLDLTGRYIMPGRSRESLLLWKLWGERQDGRPGTIEGARMPLDAAALSDADIRTITTWIDLGCAFGEGALVDDLRPTLAVRWLPVEPTSGTTTTVIVGAVDTEGLAGPPTLTLDGTALALAPVEGDDTRWQATTTFSVGEHTLLATVADRQGNTTKVDRTFTAVENPRIAELLAAIGAARAALQLLLDELTRLGGSEP